MVLSRTFIYSTTFLILILIFALILIQTVPYCYSFTMPYPFPFVSHFTSLLAHFNFNTALSQHSPPIFFWLPMLIHPPPKPTIVSLHHAFVFVFVSPAFSNPLTFHTYLLHTGRVLFFCLFQSSILHAADISHFSSLLPYFPLPPLLRWYLVIYST